MEEEQSSNSTGGLIDNVHSGEWTRNPKIVDLNDNANFLGGQPHEAFDKIREQYPLYYNYENPTWGEGFYCITRYDDIIAVSRDTETFSSASGINIAYPPDADPVIVNAVVGNMIAMDPPMHRSYRKIAQPWFTRTTIGKLEARIRELAIGILDKAAAKNEIDFMEDIAAPLPIAVLCDILGVPHTDWKKIFDWSNTLIGFDDPEIGKSQEVVEGTFLELFGYGQQMIEDRRANPREDLMTAIAQANTDDGEAIPEHYLNGFFLLMVIAGNETTRNSLSGGALALARYPDQREKLVADPTTIPVGIEEILRYVSPVNHMRRTVMKPVTMHGQTLQPGEKVVMWYGAANRDPRAFDNPHTLDVTRAPNDHLAFGIGEHFCLGSRLAQLQLRVLFEELLARFPNYEINGEIEYVRTNFINGIKTMPVRLQPRAN
ncbi:MAG: cytochrome P450 [Hyphomicrobiaceae bacterium]|jgi:cytochrome P450